MAVEETTKAKRKVKLDVDRDVLIRGVFPPLDSWVILAAVSTALLFLGLTMFKRASHRFVDEL